MANSKTLIIYHANCADGLTAAWVARKKFPKAQFFAAQYHGPRPDVKGKTVYLLDFCYKRKTLQKMKTQAKKLTVIDHHISAEEACGDLPYCTFDISKSGAGLTWDTFFPDEPRPWLVDYVEDRDLWKWELVLSKQVSAGLDAYDKTFEAWDFVAQRSFEEVAQQGNTLMGYHHTLRKQLKKDARMVKFEGYKVPVLNSTILASELGSELAVGKPFAIIWRQAGDGKYCYSLRSAVDGVDVSKIAVKYGGGGHAKASGFESDKLLF